MHLMLAHVEPSGVYIALAPPTPRVPVHTTELARGIVVPWSYEFSGHSVQATLFADSARDPGEHAVQTLLGEP